MLVKEEDLQSRVTIEAMMRFEERADVNSFALIAEAVDAEEKSVDMYNALKPALQSTKRMSAFVYECCFTDEMREETSFKSFVNGTQWMELATLFDFAYLALFTFSQDQTTQTQKTELSQEAKAEVVPTA